MEIFLFFLSPFHTFGEIGISMGYILRKLCFEDLVIEARDNETKERRIGGSIMTLGLSLFPITLVIFCVIWPLVVLCRLWQILKLFFGSVLGQCLRKVCSCCCY